MKKMIAQIRLVGLCIIIPASLTLAQVPSQLNYQGRVSVDGTNFNGTAQFQFALVDGGTNLSHQASATATTSGGFMTIVSVDSGGSGYVSIPAVTFSGGGGTGAAAHAQLGGGAVINIVVDNPGSGYATAPVVAIEAPPSNISYEVYWTNGAPMNVSVTKGLYSVALGDTSLTNMAALPSVVFTNSDVRLQVTFNDGVYGPEQLTPDSRILAAGYSLMARDIQDDTITSEKLADDAVQEIHLADGAVTASKIADTAIDTAQLVADAVTSDKIEDGSIVATDVNLSSFSNTFWKINGNAGTTPAGHFLGTTDNRGLEIRVNNQRAFRIDPAVSPRWAAGYSGNAALAAGSVVVGGGNLALGPNQVLGTCSTIAGGGDNTIESDADYSFVGGGAGNTIQSGSNVSVIGGGSSNIIVSNSVYNTIAGGFMNEIGFYAYSSAIAGGYQNKIESDGDGTSIGGGESNTIQGDADFSVISGGRSNTIQTNSQYSAIGGGSANTILTSARFSKIGGGSGNDIEPNSDHAFIGGGEDNIIHTNSDNCVIGGGSLNEITGTQCAIGGGRANSILESTGYACIAGGVGNDIQSSGSYGFIGAGYYNTIESAAWYAAIPGGKDNTIGTDADYAFAAGRRANALHAGAFVWADSQDADFLSTADNEVSFRCLGGVRFNSGTVASNQEVSWVPGDASWTFTSDKNKKEDFKPVDSSEILNKVADLPIQWWAYKGYDVRHIGPMAQDFHEAFDVGRDKKGLDGADLDGIAFAAIQGLAIENQDLKDQLNEAGRINEKQNMRLINLEKKMNQLLSPLTP
ncbi:hypothetical protein HN911_14585 [Candidatus Bathyarchaeota archaeon]|mgnify:CR=1 FL=1|jgi:hypothetical protein|nr:hypothetical protein [Candidatus Bathyarchaeota archaeon]